MLNIHLYKFQKSKDSTARPKGGGDVFPCRMMTPSSVETVTVELSGISNPANYNYMYIPDFRRYYFITERTFVGPYWHFTGAVDALASFRAEIADSMQYVIRSASQTNRRLVDSQTVAMVEPVNIDVAGDNPFTAELGKGRYVVGVVNDDPGAVGSVSYYVFTNAQFRGFCAALLGDPSWATQGIEEIGAELTKVLFNPFQYVVSCLWFPYPVGGGGGLGALPYGWWTLPGVSCSRLGSTVSAPSFTVTIPKHPDAARFGEWLSCSRFSSYTLRWPAVGTIPLDSSIVGGCSYLSCQIFVDNITGMGNLAVLLDGEKIEYEAQVQIGIPIQIAQMASNVVGGVMGGVGGVVGSLATGNVFGAINSVTSAVNEMMPQVSTLNSNGSISSYMLSPQLTCSFLHPAERDAVHQGCPLCKSVRLGELSGYVECSNAKVEIPGTLGEQENITAALNSGFYMED